LMSRSISVRRDERWDDAPIRTFAKRPAALKAAGDGTLCLLHGERGSAASSVPKSLRTPTGTNRPKRESAQSSLSRNPFRNRSGSGSRRNWNPLEKPVRYLGITTFDAPVASTRT
jgi:hypothetical protein